MNPDGFDRAPTGHTEPVDPMVGQLLDGRYQIQRKLGEGGMGEVYAAQHIRLGKLVALKLLRHEIVSNVEAVKRFEQEAKSASSIGHKNIIGILDSGELPDGRIYLSMELLDGKPLNELIKEPLSPERVLNILIQTGHGLSAAHKTGIVHRDMKPENIYVTSSRDGEEVPKLLDFGIAKMTGGEGNNHLTKTGTIFGTPFYMAPEQALGQNVDQRADIYAMGVIMYEIFTGVVPFAGESFMAILTQHITAEPKQPSRMAAEHGRTIPPGIEEIIIRAMKKEPDQRFQSMDEFVAALIAVYRGVAGAGMSSYMHALPGAPPSQVMPAARPPMPTPMPMPYGQPSAGVPQYAHHPGSAPYASQPVPGPYPGGSASFDMPRKSRAGLVVALVIVILGAGGAAAFFVVQNKGQGDDVGGTGGATQGGTTDPVHAAIDAGQAVAHVGDPVRPVDAGQPVVADSGAGVMVKPIDAGAETQPAPTLATVMVNSEPQGADVYRDGKKLKGRTPMLIKVTLGEPSRLVLKRKRYKDAQVTVDGSVEKVTPKLDKIRPDGPSTGPDPVDHTPIDPCAKDPSLPQCQLE